MGNTVKLKTTFMIEYVKMHLKCVAGFVFV